MTAQIKDKVVPVELEMRSATKNIERQYTPTIFQAYLDKLLELAAVNVTNRTWQLPTFKYFEITPLGQTTADLCRQQLEEDIQSNEAAERAARTAKRILRRTAAEDKADPFKGLLKYRNSLFEYIGVSSAQLLMRSTTTNDDTNSSASLGYLSRWIVIVF